MSPSDEAVAKMFMWCLQAAVEDKVATEINIAVGADEMPIINIAIDGASIGTYPTLARAADVLMGRMGRVLAARHRAEYAASLQATLGSAADAILLNPTAAPASAVGPAPTMSDLAHEAWRVVSIDRLIADIKDRTTCTEGDL